MANQASVIGTVILVEGVVFALNPAGERCTLNFGDAVLEGDVIVTDENGRVELAFESGGRFVLRAQESVTLDSTVCAANGVESKEASLLARVGEFTTLLNAIARGDSIDALLEETESGSSSSGSANSVGMRIDDGNGFIELLKVPEALAPASFEFSASAQPPLASPVSLFGDFFRSGQVVTLPQSSPAPSPVAATVPFSIVAPPTPAPAPTPAASISGVTAPADTTEGNPLAYSVSVANPGTTGGAAHSFVFSLGGTATAADYTGITFSNGVTLVGGNLSVPAGVASFSVTIASFDDTLVEGTETLSVTVGGQTATGNILDNDVAANQAPVASPDSLMATEDTPVTYTAAQLLGNDTDVDNTNAQLSIASVTSGAGGTAVLNAGGTVTFTPNANFNGTAESRTQ